MMTYPAHLSMWKRSFKAFPCPVYGRSKDADCSICSNGKAATGDWSIKYQPEEVINGVEGNCWPFAKVGSVGRRSHFTIDKPFVDSKPPLMEIPLQKQDPSPRSAPISSEISLEKLPTMLAAASLDDLPNDHRMVYRTTQWALSVYSESGKANWLWYLTHNGLVVIRLDASPWQQIWVDVLRNGKGVRVVEDEGQMLLKWFHADGLVCISQTGYGYIPASFGRRYREPENTVMGVQ